MGSSGFRHRERGLGQRQCEISNRCARNRVCDRNRLRRAHRAATPWAPRASSQELAAKFAIPFGFSLK